MIDEKRRRQYYLEEQYYAKKREIQRQQETLNEQLMRFRRETGQIVDKVVYLTKNDPWNKQQFYQAMEQHDSMIRQAGKRYAQQLEEEERELTKNYQQELEKLQKG